MTRLHLHPVSGEDGDFRQALTTAGLPTEDLLDAARAFFRADDEHGRVIGYSGLERCGDDVLLRSVVVLPEYRGQAMGRSLSEKTLAMASTNANVYLATTTAAAFFEQLGFKAVDRTDAPTAVLSTRQLSGICPASATIMKLTRPPT